MYENILLPTDGSDTTTETLAHALPLASDNDATLHALYVVDTRITTAAMDDSSEELIATLEAEGADALDTVVDAASEADLESVSAIRHGTPSKTILEYADEAEIDLIVIGTHGKSPRERIVSLGSVSERVVSNALIPVFVVRSDEAPSIR